MESETTKDIVPTDEEQAKILDSFHEKVLQLEDIKISKDKKFLLRFLYARKFETERALSLLYSYQHVVTEVLPDYSDIRIVSPFLSTGTIMSIPDARDKKGRKILNITPKNLDSALDGVEDRARTLLYLLHQEIVSERTQQEGFVVIIDLAGVGMHVINRPAQKLVSEVLQNAFPAKIKQIFIVNIPWFFNVLFSIAQMFMKPKMKQRVKVIYTSEELLEFIDKENLPPSLGGSNTFNVKNWAAEQVKQLETKEEKFSEVATLD